jgi:uncharacterized protein (TIGR01777 family)
VKIIVCGATGFVGRNLIPALLNEQYEITAIGRDTHKTQQIFKETVHSISWDQLNELIPSQFDAVINLAGENIAQSRWTDHSKQKIKSSRIQATQRIVTWCLKSTNKKPHLYNASAIGIYGLQPAEPDLPAALTESQTILFGKPTDFLSEVGQVWEETTNPLVEKQHPVTIMRFAVVLKRNEGVLKKLELPFSLGFGSRLGNGYQAFTWIHIDDLVQAIIFLLKHPGIIGPINLCAPECVSQKTFATSLAKTMHRPLFLNTPAALINLIFGEMGKELLLGGQNIYPERLQKINFNFLYPDLTSALNHEWQTHKHK